MSYTPEEHQQRQLEAHERELKPLMRPSASLIHEAVRRQGEEELARPLSSLAWSGLAAGLSMSLSLVGEGVIRAGLPDEPWRPLLTSFGYALGFLIVVLGRQQLFTENTLTAVIPVLHAPDRRKLARIAVLWSVVLAANLAGTIGFAHAAALTEMFAPEARRAFLDIGLEAAHSDVSTQLVRGVAAGWMIALMVWLLPAVGVARILVIVAITYFIALANLAHVIAGSAEVAYASAAGALPWTHYLGGFVLPALIGNILGGVLFVALLNHLQVRRET